MPSGYAHYRFGTALLPTMPEEVSRTARRFRSLFDMGLHGPDLFYYCSPLLKSHAGFLGIKYHEQTGREFFSRVCRMLRMEKTEGGKAYLYGLLCHYCLDSVLHPFVIAKAAEEKATHVQIETEFDRFLLETDGKIPPCAQSVSRHMQLTPGECETVARFYPPATARNIRAGIHTMASVSRLLATPEGRRRKLLELGMTLTGKELKGMLMTTAPDPLCCQLDGPLMDLYEEAAKRFPNMLAQLQAHLAYSAPFDKEFDAPFGAPKAQKQEAQT